MLKVLQRVFRFWSSYGLSCVLLFLLLVLTMLGTLQQVHQGLFATQREYFDSLFVWKTVGGVSIPVLPGVYLLLVLLAINLTCGALLRIPRRWNRVGIYIAHFGIAVLLLGAFLTYKGSVSGYLTLYQHQRSDVFRSYTGWQIVLAQLKGDGSMTERTIPVHGLEGRTRTLSRPDLPFDIALSGYAANAQPQPAATDAPGSGQVVDGFYLKHLAPERNAEQNAPGVYVTLRDKATGRAREGILWARDQAPWKITMDGKTWTMDLRRQQWHLPFTILLDKFTRILHPRTQIAETYMSNITRIEGAANQNIKISMNDPMRYKGYTVYQSGWGPQDAGPNTPLFSTFAVVKNAHLGPLSAERMPMYSCVIITLGLVIHFFTRLLNYLKTEGPHAR